MTRFKLRARFRVAWRGGPVDSPAGIMTLTCSWKVLGTGDGWRGENMESSPESKSGLRTPPSTFLREPGFWKVKVARRNRNPRSYTRLTN